MLKDFKNSLTPNDITKIVESLGGELRAQTETYNIYTSILYHRENASMHKPKMYYYFETHSFVDYKLGKNTFDIYELVSEYRECEFMDSVHYIERVLNKKIDYYKEYEGFGSGYDYMRDMGKYLSDYNRYNHCNTEPNTVKDDTILYSGYFEHKYHTDWLNDNITIKSMKKYGIMWDGWDNRIVIPCRDE